MAQLRVGDVVFHFACTRTEELLVTPVFDPSGKHYECSRIDLTLVAVVNAVCVATNKPNARGVGAGNEGDRLPNSVRELNKYLMVPRRQITYTIGGRDILDVPQLLPNGARLSCDPKGGPTPKYARFVQFAGEKSGILTFAVAAYDSRVDNYLLSHAWNVTSSVDDKGYTTRQVNGVARFRKDFLDNAILNGGTLQPDAFRTALFPPCPQGMRRIDVQVAQPASADEVQYSVTDRDATFGLGENLGVVRTEGTVTSTYSTPIRSPRDFLNININFLGRAFAVDVTGAMKAVLDATVPTNVNVGVARAYGHKGADRNNLALIAKGLIVDRFSPIKRGAANAAGQQLQGGLIVSIMKGIVAASVTHNLDSDSAPYAEVRLDIFGPNPFTGELLFQRGGVFKLDGVYTDDRNLVVADENAASPQIGPNNARGSWLGQLVSQALHSAADVDRLPEDPPADRAAVDVNKA